MSRKRRKAIIVLIVLILLLLILLVGYYVLTSWTRSTMPLGSMLSEDYSPVIDSITCDVDGDWFKETCVLSCGPTSGLFTFTLTVREFTGTYYQSTFCSEVYRLSFWENEDGTVQVRGETPGENPNVHYFDISIEDGNVLLSENGELLPYWGS